MRRILAIFSIFMMLSMETGCTDVADEQASKKDNAKVVPVETETTPLKPVEITEIATTVTTNTTTITTTTIELPTESTLSEEELKNIMSSYGNICVWEYADYDGNGTKEAFAIVGTNSMPDYYISDSIQGAYFISAKGEVKELGKTSNGLMCSIERCTEYAGKKFFSYNATAGGSGSQTYLFSVKNGNGYELSISGTIVDFYSKNNKCYATVSEFLPDGGHVWPEYELIYDESLQEFSLPNNQTNSENQIASTTEQSENVSVSDNQILKAVNKYLAENQSHLGVWLSDGNPYCPTEYMRSSDKKWSCPINLSWESYSGNEMAGAYPHFAYVDKSTLKCTLTANYETVVEFDLSDYIK